MRAWTKVFVFYKKAGNFLLHPLSMSVILTLVISLAFLPRYGKYTAEIVEKKQYQVPGVLMYDDLDGNGYSDRIVISNYPTGIGYITVSFEPSVFFQEWEFPGRFGFTGENYLLSGDYDGNG